MSAIEQQFDILILGAGLSGTLAALEMPSQQRVGLIDSHAEVVGTFSTSRNQCFKLHTGLHYAGSIKTAKKCLLDSLRFANKYRDFLLGKPGDPCRRGRYFTMSNSLFSQQQHEHAREALSDLYRELAPQYNYIFGSPENFIRPIALDDCPQIAKRIRFTNEDGSEQTVNVVNALETGEAQIDMPRLRQHLQHEVDTQDNIQFIGSHIVQKVTFDVSSLMYRVAVLNLHSGTQYVLTAPYVLNCTWQNIEKLNHPNTIDTNKMIRIKSSLIVKLPASLRQMNTCLFSIGPFCSFTNLGNGTAIITEESVTNLHHYFAGADVDNEHLTTLLSEQNRLANPIGKKIASTIQERATRFIPELKQAQPLHLAMGHVKVPCQDAEYSLYSKCSPIHTREESGIEVQGLGLLSVSGMKMTYTYSNALMVKHQLALHKAVRTGFMIWLNYQMQARAYTDTINASTAINFIASITKVPAPQIANILPKNLIETKLAHYRRKPALLV